MLLLFYLFKTDSVFLAWTWLTCRKLGLALQRSTAGLDSLAVTLQLITAGIYWLLHNGAGILIVQAEC